MPIRWPFGWAAMPLLITFNQKKNHHEGTEK
jgi:hypothetical protein